MRSAAALTDVTGEVPVDDAVAVATACERLLADTFGAASSGTALLHAAFADVARIFDGGDPRYHACDLPYHDLRHSLDTALVAARLVAGWQRDHRDTSGALTPELGTLAILLALLHDIGLVRRREDAVRCGAELMPIHEARSVDVARAWLANGPLRAHAPLAALILATRLAPEPSLDAGARDPRTRTVGRIVGTADLVSQLADRDYLERCYHHLHPEFVLAGLDRVKAADGTERLLYEDAFDLLRKTPAFYDGLVRKRLDEDLGGVARCLADDAGNDRYAAAIAANVERCRRIVAEGGPGRLGPEPRTTTRSFPRVAYGPTASQR